MAESRAERMLGRMRGAQRHEVADISFGFDLGLESPDAAAGSPPPPPPGPQQRTTPNSSAKRRRLNSSQPQEQLGSAAPVPGSGGTRSQPRRAAKSSSPYDIPEFSEEESASARAARAAGAAPAATGPSPRLGGLTPRQAGVLVEEVGESPADAPGSGSRRRVRISGAASQSAALQSVIGGSGGRLGGHDEDEDEDPVAVSSPLTRMSRRSEAASARSGRTSLRRVTRVSPTAGEEVDELSPVSAAAEAPQHAGGSSPPLGKPSARKSAQAAQPAARSAARRQPRSPADQGEMDELSPTASVEAAAQVPSSSPLVQRSRRQGRPAPEASVRSSTRKSTRPAAQAVSEPDELSPDQPAKAKRGRPRKSQEELPPQQQEPEEPEEAEEIGEKEAAARLGRKRPRRSLHEPSPELGSQPNNEEPTPVPKSRRRQAKPSPAKQKQPQQQKQRKKKGEGKAQSRKRKAVEVEAGEPVPVQVQRFTRKIHTAENETDTDILAADIPYSNRAGVNAVDVLSQMCEEIIDMTLEKLHENAVNAEDAATKREFRVKLRAVEAFQEELRTRLLEHTIALDTLHALRKRVRAAQKDKLALRDEILRIRAEREQVALRMDATRIRHEAERKEALHHIELSSTMHDIDLVVEKGQAAPELAPAELKVAELNNLELLISRVADQACSKSDGGGVLGHIRGFNEFLERAAAVLEGR